MYQLKAHRVEGILGGREQDRNVPHMQCQEGHPSFIEFLLYVELWDSRGKNRKKKPPLASRKQLCGKR